MYFSHFGSNLNGYFVAFRLRTIFYFKNLLLKLDNFLISRDNLLEICSYLGTHVHPNPGSEFNQICHDFWVSSVILRTIKSQLVLPSGFGREGNNQRVKNCVQLPSRIQGQSTQSTFHFHQNLFEFLSETCLLIASE